MNEIKIRKSTLYLIGIILLIAIGIFMIMKYNSYSTENVINDNPNGDIQKVVLGIKDYNYYPNTVTVQVGRPVRIYLDSSVSGCYRSFTIKDFGIAKNLRTPNDYVEFTPTKAGTYRFACSMGMGTGTLIVE